MCMKNYQQYINITNILQALNYWSYVNAALWTLRAPQDSSHMGSGRLSYLIIPEIQQRPYINL